MLGLSLLDILFGQCQCGLLYPQGHEYAQAQFSEQRDFYAEERTWSKAFEHLAVSVAQLTLDGDC